MKIIRFIDSLDFIRHGVLREDGSTVLLEGDLFGEHRAGTTRAEVKKLLAPLAPVAIPCIGLNYRHHAAESGAPIPQHPVLFHKAVSAVQNPGDAIEIPTQLASTQVDYECELAVVIGKRAKNVSKADALELRPRLHLRQRRQRPRLAERLGRQPVVPRQDLRHLLPARPLHRHARTRSPIRTRCRSRPSSTARRCRTGTRTT